MKDIISFLKEEFNEQRGTFTFSRKKVSEIIRALEDYTSLQEKVKEIKAFAIRFASQCDPDEPTDSPYFIEQIENL